MLLGVMTGGGDCPGLNAVIQAIVSRATEYKFDVLGIIDGYDGLLKGKFRFLSLDDVDGIFEIGGTILGTSRKNPLNTREDQKKVLENIEKFGIDALITIGGDDTLGIAYKLFKLGVPTVGVPKTIDNDLSATDYCVGFQTAVDTVAQAISRIHTTANSHHRVIIVEIMGRYAGWLTLMGGLAGGAHLILIPEKEFNIESVCKLIERRNARGKYYTVIAVAEGAKPESTTDYATINEKMDEFGHKRLGGIAKALENEISKRTGKNTRSIVLGHVQRGGSPNPFDRILGIRLGLLAVDLVKENKFGYAAVFRNTETVSVRLEKIVGQTKTLQADLVGLTSFFSEY